MGNSAHYVDTVHTVNEISCTVPMEQLIPVDVSRVFLGSKYNTVVYGNLIDMQIGNHFNVSIGLTKQLPMIIS